MPGEPWGSYWLSHQGHWSFSWRANMSHNLCLLGSEITRSPVTYLTDMTIYHHHSPSPVPVLTAHPSAPLLTQHDSHLPWSPPLHRFSVLPTSPFLQSKYCLGPHPGPTVSWEQPLTSGVCLDLAVGHHHCCHSSHTSVSTHTPTSAVCIH